MRKARESAASPVSASAGSGSGAPSTREAPATTLIPTLPLSDEEPPDSGPDSAAAEESDAPPAKGPYDATLDTGPGRLAPRTFPTTESDSANTPAGAEDGADDAEGSPRG
jgi:hypothetical protein